MKKTLLTLAACFIAGSLVFGQQAKYIKNNPRKGLPMIEPVSAGNAPASIPTPPAMINSANIIQIGLGPNAFGTGFGARTNVWADKNLNSIVFVHRGALLSGGGQDPNSGYLRYDVSKDGGLTWTSDEGPLYMATGGDPGNNTDAAVSRYPQGAILNSTGNTVADNAYVTYFAPSRDASNPDGASSGDWGGIVYGVQKLSGAPSVPTQTQLSSDAVETGKKYFLPDGFIVTQQNKAITLDLAIDGSNGSEYMDSLIIMNGVWNAGISDIEYTEKHILAKSELHADGSHMMAASNIAFSPDGQKGYITLIGKNKYDVGLPDSSYNPIIYKTTDGGSTWVGATSLDLKNINNIFNFYADPTQTDSSFTTAFEIDLSVDNAGNAHIIMGLGAKIGANGFSINTTPGQWGIFDIHTPDGGTTWKASLLATPMTFRGSFGDGSTTNPTVNEDNRPQSSTTWDGSKLFFSWFDTDTIAHPNPNGDNMRPDLWVRGYDPANHLWTPAKNVTGGTPADGRLTQGNVSYYVLDSADAYKIPVTFGDLTTDSIATGTTMQYYYLADALMLDADFTLPEDSIETVDLDSYSVTTSEQVIKLNNESVKVYPNPFSQSTTFALSMNEAAQVSMNVRNVLGQTVVSENYGMLNAGRNSIRFNANGLGAGIYFYTVTIGANTTSGKMMIQR